MEELKVEEKVSSKSRTYRRKCTVCVNDLTLEITKNVGDDDKETTYHYELKETTAEFLKYLRSTDIPTFVLKRDGMLYYCCFIMSMKYFKFSNTTLSTLHKCAFENTICKRLISLPDELGGCSKVFNMSIGIENYPWITDGYETFNFFQKQENGLYSSDIFVVINCNHYEQVKFEITEEENEKKKKESKKAKKPRMTPKEYRLYSVFS